MKFIEGLIAAFQGNAKEKLNDPLIGSFVFSFVLWNWNYFLLLFFGDKAIDERIVDCITSLSLFSAGWEHFFKSLDVYVTPALLAIFYVFYMPHISIWISVKLKPLVVSKHAAAVDLEIEQADKQQELNKRKLISDPNKDFLGKLVIQDIRQKELETEKKQADSEKAKLDAEKAKIDVEKAKVDAAKAVADKEIVEANSKKAIKDEEVQRIKSEHEKKRIEVGDAITNSMLHANAYFSCFNFVRKLSESLANDGISLTHKSLTDIIAAVFGYSDFDDLLGDNTFHNEGLKKLKYILLDSKYLSDRLEEILSEDVVDEEVCNSYYIFGHLTMMFESFPYLYGDDETIANAIFEEIEANKLDLIDTDAVSGAIASTDSIIEEIDLTLKDVSMQDSGLEIVINGHGSGTHRKDSSIRGQGIDITINVTVPLLWGRYGLGRYTVITSSDPESFDDEWEDA